MPFKCVKSPFLISPTLEAAKWNKHDKEPWLIELVWLEVLPLLLPLYFISKFRRILLNKGVCRLRPWKRPVAVLGHVFGKPHWVFGENSSCRVAEIAHHRHKKEGCLRGLRLSPSCPEGQMAGRHGGWASRGTSALSNSHHKAARCAGERQRPRSSWHAYAYDCTFSGRVLTLLRSHNKTVLLLKRSTTEWYQKKKKPRCYSCCHKAKPSVLETLLWWKTWPLQSADTRTFFVLKLCHKNSSLS